MAKFNNTFNPSLPTAVSNKISGSETYYLSETGSNSNDGKSAATPLRDLNGFNNILKTLEILDGGTVTLLFDKTSSASFGSAFLKPIGRGNFAISAYGSGTQQSSISLNIEGDDKINFQLREININSLNISDVKTCVITNANFTGSCFVRRFESFEANGTISQGSSLSSLIILQGLSAAIRNYSLTRRVFFQSVLRDVTLNSCTCQTNNTGLSFQKVFFAAINDLTIDSYNGSSSTYLISATDSRSVKIEDIDFNNSTVSRLIDIDASEVLLKGNFTNVPTTNISNLVSPIKLANNSTLSIGASVPTSKMRLTGAIVNIDALSKILSSSETLDNVPYSGSTGLTTGQVLGLIDADEVKFSSSNSNATNVKDAIEEALDNKTKKEVHFSGAIRGTIAASAAQDLRHSDRVPFNLVPHVVKFAANITQVILVSNGNVNFALQVIINGTVRETLVKNNNSRYQIFTLSRSVSQGDLVRLRFAYAAAEINSPAAQVTYAEREVVNTPALGE